MTETINLPGKTVAGLRLPALGIGTAPLGNMYRVVGETDVAATLAAAQRAGMDYVDTAPHYGQGLAERRVGAFLAQAAGRPVLSTKVGRRLVPIEAPPPGARRHGFVDGDPFDPVFDYSYDGVMRTFEGSLLRLGVERVDMLLAHDLGAMIHRERHDERLREFLNGGYRAMAELKAQGRVRAIGLGVNEWQVCAQALAHCDLDVLMLAGRYTLLDQSSLDVLLPECERRGTVVLLAGPFNSGILVEGVGSGSTPHYNYAPATEPVIQRVRQLEAVCQAFGVPLPAAALQFPLGHAVVPCVVTGFASAAQVAAAVAWINAPIPDAFWLALQSEGLLHPAAPLPIRP